MTDNRFIFFLYLLTLNIFTNTALNAQLKDHANQCDYLIITPSKFVNSLKPFVDWREQKKLKVKIAELEQIYLEFTEPDSWYSIRDFVSHALTYWNDPKPQYLLLVGGVNQLPSYRVRSQFADDPHHKEDSVSIDEWYSVNQFDSDTKPDIAIGRFPVDNEDELNNIIKKTMSFEDSLLSDDFTNDFIFLTDKSDSLAFEREATSFMNLCVPTYFSNRTIFAGQDSTIEKTRDDLFDGLLEGTLFLSYYGHGNPHKLSKYGLFTIDDIDTLKQNTLPFIYTAAACSQSFDEPEDSSIVRRLIVLPKGGTVASVASTGLEFLDEGAEFLSYFYNNIFEQPDTKIGEAFLKTKILQNSFSSQRYALLGDPALKIPITIIANITDRLFESPNSYMLMQNYPNPFNPSTIIEYSIPEGSFVTLKVLDILCQEITTLVNEEKQAGNYKIKFDGSNLTSGIYFYQINANDFVEIKKFTLTK